MAQRILIVDDDPDALRLIRYVLNKEGFDVVLAQSGSEALQAVASQSIDLIVLDVMMPDMDGYQVCERLRKDASTAQIPVIMLTAKAQVEDKVRGFRVGADDYVVKPFDRRELVLRIKALLARTPVVREEPKREAPRSRVISVFSPRGGVGKTTMAVNLAVSLAQMWGARVALVDMALEADQVALMLNLQPKYTWANLAERKSDTVDEDFLFGLMMPHTSGVKLLGAPESPVSASLVTPKLVEQVIPTLKSQFEYIVIDLPPSFDELNLVAMELSDRVILMLAPELGSLKAIKTTLDIFQSLDYGHDRISLVLNTIFPKRALPERNIEEALALPIDLILPYEHGFVEAINSGIPFVLNHGSAKATTELQKYAYELSGREAQNPSDKPASEVLSRVRAAFGKR